ncbi:hypothetical protein RIF29_14093 [Crotalaria pallida]|uniref:Uncharacterized protein n=1 Tax=Crotalaria pallida TaxID=3830 RepID=A0AAN9FAR9_CROPI
MKKKKWHHNIMVISYNLTLEYCRLLHENLKSRSTLFYYLFFFIFTLSDILFESYRLGGHLSFDFSTSSSSSIQSQVNATE